MSFDFVRTKPEKLRPGDVWCDGNDDHLPWILLGSKRVENVFGLKIWNLTWFGQTLKNSISYEVIEDEWTNDSVFKIINMDNNED
jgi:hypothetical protein